ncbi:MAG: endolytic transglycosylase MltG [Clostridia bacterium]|nr:endolytic transglycosylase MltG [Clostridia bacterium]
MKKLLISLLICTLTLCSCRQIGMLLSGPSSSTESAGSPSQVSSTAASESPAPTPSQPSGSTTPSTASTVSQTVSRLPATVKVTVPEGYSMTQIFELLEQNNVSTVQKLLSTAQTYDYSYYPLVAAIKADEHRAFLLEGLLFPDTYEFYTNQKPQDAIGIFLRNAEKKLTESLRTKAADLGLSVDELLTLASIIEKECGKAGEMKNVSAVLHNRLAIGMKLQCDVTIHYVERYLKPYLDGDINRYNSYYNTYKCAALPSGPICNPGMAAINAALSPADNDYLYFVTDAAGNYYYAADHDTHVQNCQLAGITLD